MQLGCDKAGLLSLGCPGWDTLPGLGGRCCPPVDVEGSNGCWLLGGSNIDWIQKDNFQDNGLLHHSEHKATRSWGQEYLKSILATNQ